jgi:hypothetical protein
MALTYEESADLMRDSIFISRIKVACLHFAAYISGEDPTTTAHNTRYRWAINTMNAPDTAAANITPTVVMDPNVQAQGAAILDVDLQTAVETAVNKII